MDLCLTLLLICLCSLGTTNAEVAEDQSIPLIPLIPSQPIEEGESQGTPETTTLNETIVTATSDLPTARKTSPDEEKGDGCQAISRRPDTKQTITAAIQRLGVQLLQNLETTPEQPNVIISPLSISLALSQLALGAKNETEELLMYHLHENTVPCYHESLRHVLTQLRNSDVQIATRMFLRQGFKGKQEFVSESQRFYDSEPAIVESLQQINEWVENATEGKMMDFLSSLPPNLLLMLINAVYFKGEWKARFDPSFTSKGVFYLDDLHLVDVDMMDDAKHQLSFLTDSELEAQVARFPFTKNMSLVVIMPESGKVNVSLLSSNLNISNLYERLPKERAAQVKVPKFKLEYSQELQEVLTKLGLGEMFLNPNLAGIADGPLLVSSVMHKSGMEINEDGARAAAATATVISRASNPIFHLSQPFFFVLMDDVTRIPIFMGVINNPNPGAPVLQRGDVGSKDKVNCYPGVQIKHASHILKKARTSKDAKKVQLSFGINNKDYRDQNSIQKLLNTAQETFPYADIYVSLLNFSDRLNFAQRQNPSMVNQTIDSVCQKLNHHLIPKIQDFCFHTMEDRITITLGPILRNLKNVSKYMMECHIR